MASILLHTFRKIFTSPGFGYTAAEAMEANKPIVAFDVGGLSELIETGVTGYLVSPYRLSNFASRVIELLQDRAKAEAMGKAAGRKVRKDFSMELFTQNMIEVYDLLEAKTR